MIPIIPPGAHLDHGVPAPVLAWAVAQCAGHGLIRKTLTLPDWAADLACDLIGPATRQGAVSDRHAVWARRGDRPHASRCVHAEPGTSREITVICGPWGAHAPHPDQAGVQVLYTAFGGPLAPPEPWDARLAPGSDELRAAVAFWSRHALVMRPEYAPDDPPSWAR